MKIVDIQTAVPEYAMKQVDALETLRNSRDLSRQEAFLYRRFMMDPGIGTRHFAIDQVADCFTDSQDELIQRFEREAGQLSAQAVQNCWGRHGLMPQHIDRLVTATCTGYICPGLSSHIIERVKLAEDIFAVDLVGMGCGAALPMLRTLCNDTCLSEGQVSLGVCTEICSAAISWEDDPGLILSNAIFGDGSAAVVWGHEGPGWCIKGFCFKTIPAWRDKLRFVTKLGKLYNVLTPEVPELAAQTLDQTVNALLAKTGDQKEDIRFWALHAGGRKVIDAIAEPLCLDEQQVSFSREVLYDFGNMSSPTVLFVLKKIWEQGEVQPGDKVLMATFGAGFSMYTALLQYTDG